LLLTGRNRAGDTRFLLRIGLYSFVILVGCSIAVMAIRYKYIADSRSIARHMSETFIFVPAFCKWFAQTDVSRVEPLWGFRTFWKTFERMGFTYEPEEVIFVEQTSSNIYTLFRGLIEDFTLVGSCLWLFMVGFIGKLAFRGVVRGKPAFLPMLAVIYAYIFVGTSFSLFSYNVTNAATTIFIVHFLWLCLFQARSAPAWQRRATIPVAGTNGASVRNQLPARIAPRARSQTCRTTGR
jgi:hypothetical protein